MNIEIEGSSVKESAGSFLVVSYDIQGEEKEIETYLFNSAEVDKEKVCQLRQKYETMVNIDCLNRGVHEEGSELPFLIWVQNQGILCLKVPQYRVEPIEAGSLEFDVYDMENR